MDEEIRRTNPRVVYVYLEKLTSPILAILTIRGIIIDLEAHIGIMENTNMSVVPADGCGRISSLDFPVESH